MRVLHRLPQTEWWQDTLARQRVLAKNFLLALRVVHQEVSAKILTLSHQQRPCKSCDRSQPFGR